MYFVSVQYYISCCQVLLRTLLDVPASLAVLLIVSCPWYGRERYYFHRLPEQHFSSIPVKPLRAKSDLTKQELVHFASVCCLIAIICQQYHYTYKRWRKCNKESRTRFAARTYFMPTQTYVGRSYRQQIVTFAIWLAHRIVSTVLIRFG